MNVYVNTFHVCRTDVDKQLIVVRRLLSVIVNPEITKAESIKC